MKGTPALMLTAARALLDALTPAQRDMATFAFDDAERFVWHYTPVARQGVALVDLSAEQRQLALGLAATGYSAAGFWKATAIMSLDAILLDLERNRARRLLRDTLGPETADLMLRRGHERFWSLMRDPDLYFVSIFGEPSADTTWGWRLEGHHVSLNVTLVDGCRLAAAPTFFGANPAQIRTGPRAGLRVLAAEEDLARELMATLGNEQRARAVIAPDAPPDILTFNQVRAQPLDDAGLPASELSSAGRDCLIALLEAYAGALPAEIAAARMAAVRAAAPADLRFAWLGGLETGTGHYYRIQSPTFLVEYDNTQDDANHIHTVWRDFAGDWALDLLGHHLVAEHA